MAASQAMISEQLISAYRFGKHQAMLDVGGGTGAFGERSGNGSAELATRALFDSPDVVAGAEARLNRDALIGPRLTLHEGSFLHDPLPQGMTSSHSRAFHDHDDEPALRLLRAVRAALAPQEEPC